MPEMVPEPNRSPTRSVHPVIVWCAIICRGVQYRCCTRTRTHLYEYSTTLTVPACQCVSVSVSLSCHSHEVMITDQLHVQCAF